MENRFSKDEIAYSVVCKHLKDMQKDRIDTLILGCTHYPILKNMIMRVMGDEVTLVDSSGAVAEKVREVLRKNNMMRSEKCSPGWTRCYVSDDVKGFKDTARIFFKEDLSVKKVVL